MEDFALVFNTIIDILKIKYEIYGYEISFWNIGVFFTVSGLLGWSIWEVLNRD